MIVLLLAQAAAVTPPAAAAPVAQVVPIAPAPNAASAVPAPSGEAASPVVPAPATVASAPARRHAPGDRFERFNRRNFARQQKLDRHFFHPVAMAYKHVVPAFLRGAIRHIFSNLGEPVVFLNYVLQLKPGKAIETAARFTINSTLGIGGAVDLAKSPGVRLPHRPNGFGDTLGYYGVKPGPYLFLPFIGPTDLRDVIGGQVDGAVLPLAIGKPYDRLWFQLPRGVLTGLDERAENDDDLHALLDGAVDPYATLRSVFLQDRAGEIAQLHGRPRPAAEPADGARAPELDDPLADPAAKSSRPSATPELQDPLTDPAAPSAGQPAPTPQTSGASEPQETPADPATANSSVRPAPTEQPPTRSP